MSTSKIRKFKTTCFDCPDGHVVTGGGFHIVCEKTGTYHSPSSLCDLPIKRGLERWI